MRKKLKDVLNDVEASLTAMTNEKGVNVFDAVDYLPRFTTITDYQIWCLVVKLDKPTQKEIRRVFQDYWGHSISENGLRIHMRFLCDMKVIYRFRKGKPFRYVPLPVPTKILKYDSKKYASS